MRYSPCQGISTSESPLQKLSMHVEPFLFLHADHMAQKNCPPHVLVVNLRNCALVAPMHLLNSLVVALAMPSHTPSIYLYVAYCNHSLSKFFPTALYWLLHSPISSSPTTEKRTCSQANQTIRRVILCHQEDWTGGT